MVVLTEGNRDLREWDELMDESERHRFHVEDYSHQATVRDIMTTEVVCVDETCSVVEMMHTMARARIHRLIVVRNRAVVGIVTALDIVEFWAARLARVDCLQ